MGRRAEGVPLRSDGGRLVFKGGTAIRFVHIPDYRYSADLDFTVIGGNAADAATALDPVLEAARQLAGFPHLERIAGPSPSISYVSPAGGVGGARLTTRVKDWLTLASEFVAVTVIA